MNQISSGGTAFVARRCFAFSVFSPAFFSLLITHHISSSLNKLKIGTEHISEGNFDFDARIDTEDEIGSLSQSFTAMGKRLRKLEEMYLDASPLTRLPGATLSLRPGPRQFQAFNDQYGYANGQGHQQRISLKMRSKKGSSEDFIGHVGGDDFVVITTPAFMREISAEIIAKFDRHIPDFYAAEDRARGYIDGKTRQGVAMHFPIMSISIAIVTNERREFNSALEASEIAAELKDYAKTIPKSVFVVDKRRNA
jgi:GGDEF domain-containing protein/HAMP domain-containing protein